MYMEIKRRMPIGVELVKRGIVTENDIEKALEYQREHPNVKLGDILHILNVCDDEILIRNVIKEYLVLENYVVLEALFVPLI